MTTRRRIVAALALSLFPLATPLAAQQAPRAVGSWEGALNVGALNLRLAFEIQRDSAGALGGTLISIDQGGARIPLTATERGDSVRFEAPAIQAVYRGRLSARADSIDGEWVQGAMPLALDLRRVARVTMPSRPQEPKPPFPYAVEEVTFPSAEAGVTLAGTLTLPRGQGPFPAVVLVSGSGPQDRDEALLGHKPFLVLADHLTRRGIAVLRFDDRGIGKSTGRFSTATSEDFAEDALGGVRFLRARPEVARAKVGIAGHSEGGLIAPLVAVQAPDEVGFLVLLAGTGLPGDSILKLQGRLIAQAAGTPPATLDRNQVAQTRMFAAVREGGDSTALLARLKTISDQLIAELSEEERRASGVTPEMMDQQIQQLATPWFRYFLTYDPRPTLARVRVPVLAVNGALDLQVPSKANLEAIEAALRSGGNTRVRTVEFPGLNHLFQTTKTGSPAEYGTIEETMSPAMLETVSAWILENFGPGK
jgi:uncharacterized protein